MDGRILKRKTIDYLARGWQNFLMNDGRIFKKILKQEPQSFQRMKVRYSKEGRKLEGGQNIGKEGFRFFVGRWRNI